jgi:hypothetical protein
MLGIHYLDIYVIEDIVVTISQGRHDTGLALQQTIHLASSAAAISSPLVAYYKSISLFPTQSLSRYMYPD